mgnify:CR=1 FL=1|tara:strand:+ start:6108 stop:6890 length:783 start_codon:yes stop_codon:yes gene_type:complete
MKGGNLDDISTANRYFRYECAGIFGNVAGQLEANKTLRFRLPPLSEIGFSNNFSQCLVKIRRVIVGDRGFYNPVWAQGTGVVNYETVPAGITVQTNIPCRNFGSVRGDIAPMAEVVDQRFGQCFVPKWVDGVIVDDTALAFNAELPALQTSAGAKKQIVGINGAVAGAGAGTPAVPNQIVRGNGYYCMEDESSIFETGMLCGVPFGNTLEVKFKENYANLTIGLVDYTDTQTFIGGVTIVLEFLMLPNPTPTSNRGGTCP